MHPLLKRYDLNGQTVNRKSTSFEQIKWVCDAVLDSGVPYGDMLQYSIFPDLKVEDSDTYVSRISKLFVNNLFKKVEIEIPGYNPDVQALADFERDEEVCRGTNLFLLNNLDHPKLHGVVSRIRQMFNELDPMVPTIGEVYEKVRDTDYTPGAAVKSPRYTCVAHRLMHVGLWYPASVTKKYVSTDPLRAEMVQSPYYPYINGKTVPKTYKTARLIGTSSYDSKALQVCLGRLLREVLKLKCNIDLSTQQEKHRNIVRLFWQNACVATNDVRGGSNSLAKNLVLLFGPRLRNVVEHFRINSFRLNGEERDLQMLLPSGCGFTFELETLVFYVLTSAFYKLGLRNRYVSVFGDDIICPSYKSDTYVKYMRTFGVVINAEKSYYGTAELESCGEHIRFGRTVKTPSLKSFGRLVDCYKAINRVRDRCYDPVTNLWIHPTFRRLWWLLVTRLDPKDRLFCPSSFGDVGINYDIEFANHNVHSSVLESGAWIRKYFPYRVRAERVEHEDKFGRIYHSHHLVIQVLKSTPNYTHTYSDVAAKYPADIMLQACVHPSFRGCTAVDIADEPKMFKLKPVDDSLYWGYVSFLSSGSQEDPLSVFNDLNTNMHAVANFLGNVSAIQRNTRLERDQRLTYSWLRTPSYKEEDHRHHLAFQEEVEAMLRLAAEVSEVDNLDALSEIDLDDW